MIEKRWDFSSSGLCGAVWQMLRKKEKLLEPEGMAHSVKCMLHKPEDLSSSSSTCMKCCASGARILSSPCWASRKDISGAH